MVPTVKENYSILSTVFCPIFFDEFLKLLFSPFTRNFVSAVKNEIKIFHLSDCMIQRSCEILTTSFLKKISKYTKRYFGKGHNSST